MQNRTVHQTTDRSANCHPTLPTVSKSPAARHESVIEVPLPTEAPASHPHAVAEAYRDRLRTLEVSEKDLQRKHLQLGYLRLAFGIAIVVLLLPPRLWTLFPLCAFAIAARAHNIILRRLAETRRAIALYQHAIARTEDRSAGLRPRPTRLDSSQSLFAEDLDLFGPGSLFELLCETRTSLGEDTLASWLLKPAPVSDVLARQNAVADLRSRLHLREATARAPGPATAMLDIDALSSWAEAHVELPRALRYAVPFLIALFLAAAWAASFIHSALPIVFVAVVNGSLTFLLRRSFQPLFAKVSNVSRSLHTAEALIAAFEDESLTAAHLQALQNNFMPGGRRASKAIARFAAISTWIDARSNYVVRILDVLLPYSLQLALIVDRWQSVYDSQLRPWLETMAEFEALLSLAAYSFEHSEDPFPEFTNDAPAFQAKGLTHPLLGQVKGIRNDVLLDRTTRLILISGSNMSGKSTLLRSVGINAVLAFAGAPVRAHSLRLSPLTVVASIQVNDSLQAGQSRFYAEILRLRALTEAARLHPHVLFLLDELLAGTNSSDRLLGAQGIVEELVREGAVGLLSTHDLALTAIAASHTGISNAHFEDQVTEERLLFDYKLREGVLQQSNGLALMRLVGLKV